jgi:hypothetical protein
LEQSRNQVRSCFLLKRGGFERLRLPRGLRKFLRIESSLQHGEIFVAAVIASLDAARIQA